jgi:hypothetical protein
LPIAATTAPRSAQALVDKGIEPCIPSSRSRKIPYFYDKMLYRQRHKVENLFAKLKDWRRIATRYDRCVHTFFSAICIAAAVIFWLSSKSPEPRLPRIVRPETFRFGDSAPSLRSEEAHMHTL